MLKSASGIVMVPNEPQLKISNWKDRGTFMKFRVVSQEATQAQVAKLHHYYVNMYVPNDEVAKWKEKIIPGQMFLLANGSVSALIPEGKEYPIVEIRVDRGDLSYLKKAVTTGE